MKTFVDTSAWLALEIEKDIHHKAAKQHAKILEKERALFFTNEYVLAETYTRIIYDVHLSAAYQFHQHISHAIKEEELVVLEVDPSIREEVWKELLRYSDHKLSFTDASIIVAFKLYKLDEIFTFDRHFKDINLPTNL